MNTVLLRVKGPEGRERSFSGVTSFEITIDDYTLVVTQADYHKQLLTVNHGLLLRLFAFANTH